MNDDKDKNKDKQTADYLSGFYPDDNATDEPGIYIADNKIIPNYPSYYVATGNPYKVFDPEHPEIIADHWSNKYVLDRPSAIVDRWQYLVPVYTGDNELYDQEELEYACAIHIRLIADVEIWKDNPDFKIMVNGSFTSRDKAEADNVAAAYQKLVDAINTQAFIPTMFVR